MHGCGHAAGGRDGPRRVRAGVRRDGPGQPPHRRPRHLAQVRAAAAVHRGARARHQRHRESPLELHTIHRFPQLRLKESMLTNLCVDVHIYLPWVDTCLAIA